MSQIEWFDGWSDDPAEGERDMAAVAESGLRYRIPPELWLEGQLAPRVRISFTLRKRRKNGTPVVDKLILRP